MSDKKTEIMRHHNAFFYYGFAVFTSFLMTLVSCSTSTQNQSISANISDTQAREIIERSIEYHGGMKIYNQLDSFHFEKDFSLYEADGSVEYQRLQYHDYSPSQSVYHIRWEQEGDTYKNSQNSSEFSQEINDRKNTSIDDSKIKSAIDASVFAIFLPWKLLDAGASISYDGETTLTDGKEVYVVKAIYDPGQHDNHTKSDTWWHYFDKKSYRHEGYKVALIDHTSLVSNLDFQTVNGFTFPKTRKSWRLNESNEKEYLRADYDYKIMKIK